MGDGLWEWNTTSGSGEGVATGEGKIGEISPCFCPILFRDQPTPAAKSSAWTPAQFWGQCGSSKKFSKVFTPISSLCPDTICRACSDFTPKSLLERATLNSQLSQGMLLGFQGCDKPRSLLQAEAALPRAGHSLGGRLSTGTEQHPRCLFASVINHQDIGKGYSSSKQALSQAWSRRREI